MTVHYVLYTRYIMFVALHYQLICKKVLSIKSLYMLSINMYLESMIHMHWKRIFPTHNSLNWSEFISWIFDCPFKTVFLRRLVFNCIWFWKTTLRMCNCVHFYWPFSQSTQPDTTNLLKRRREQKIGQRSYI